MRSFVFFISLLTHVSYSSRINNNNRTEIRHKDDTNSTKIEYHRNRNRNGNDDKYSTNSTKIEDHRNRKGNDDNKTETEHHLHKRYYGKNQNRNGSNDKSIVKRKVEKAEKVENVKRKVEKVEKVEKVKRKVEKVEKVEVGVHKNRNRSSIN